MTTLSVTIHVLGIDLAKSIFQLHGVTPQRRVVLTRGVQRQRLLEMVAQIESCLIGIEACSGASIRFGPAAALEAHRDAEDQRRGRRDEAVVGETPNLAARLQVVGGARQRDNRAFSHVRSWMIAACSPG